MSRRRPGKGRGLVRGGDHPCTRCKCDLAWHAHRNGPCLLCAADPEDTEHMGKVCVKFMAQKTPKARGKIRPRLPKSRRARKRARR